MRQLFRILDDEHRPAHERAQAGATIAAKLRKRAAEVDARVREIDAAEVERQRRLLVTEVAALPYRGGIA